MKKIKWILLLVIAIPLVHHLVYPKASRCLWVGLYGDFESLGDRVWVSSDTPASVRTQLIQLLVQARQRNDTFWKGCQGRPKIIYTHRKDHHARYAWTHSPATTFYTPFDVVIVLSTEGMDPDVISHEMCHTELYHRLGWWRREWQIPTWFDEGLAMQLDYRPAYAETAYVGLLDSLSHYPEIRMKSTPALFWQGGPGEVKQHYILAKHEVAHWLEQSGKDRLFSMIDQLIEGDKFLDIYTPSQ